MDNYYYYYYNNFLKFTIHKKYIRIITYSISLCTYMHIYSSVALSRDIVFIVCVYVCVVIITAS